MPKELQRLTDDTYVLEVRTKNLMYFYRNDHKALGYVESAHIVLMAKFIVSQIDYKYDFVTEKAYEFEHNFELSRDGKVLRIILESKRPPSPQLHAYKDELDACYEPYYGKYGIKEVLKGAWKRIKGKSV